MRDIIKHMRLRFYEGEEKRLERIRTMLDGLPCDANLTQKLLLGWLASKTKAEQLAFITEQTLREDERND